MGITVAGSSFGGIVWPIALHRLLNNFGFGWAVRTTAFIMIPLLAVACLTIDRPAQMANQLKAKPNLECLKNPVILLVGTGLVFVWLGLFSPFFYVTPWALSKGFDADISFYMISIVNAASMFGRIIPGLVADRIGCFNVMIIVILTSGVIQACWTEATSLADIVIWSLAYGFASGVCGNLLQISRIC